MNVHGTHTLADVTISQLWDALLNPSLLVKVLPYCQDIAFLVPDKRAIVHLKSSLGQAEEQSLTVELDIIDPQRPHGFGFQFMALHNTAEGALSGGGTIYLTAEDEDVAVRYDIHGEATGFFAQMGAMFLETIVRGMMRELLSGLESVLHQEELVPTPVAAPATADSHLKQWLVIGAAVLVPVIGWAIWRKRHS
ncbi:MAG: hypothetical protein KDE51_26020 [Anaerolineales bacterium]|nr:hypothetical protein [Anaerolineales bacterium]